MFSGKQNTVNNVYHAVACRNICRCDVSETIAITNFVAVHVFIQLNEGELFKKRDYTTRGDYGLSETTSGSNVIEENSGQELFVIFNQQCLEYLSDFVSVFNVLSV